MKALIAQELSNLRRSGKGCGFDRSLFA